MQSSGINIIRLLAVFLMFWGAGSFVDRYYSGKELSDLKTELGVLQEKGSENLNEFEMIEIQIERIEKSNEYNYSSIKGVVFTLLGIGAFSILSRLQKNDKEQVRESVGS